MNFPDFPFPKDGDTYVHHTEVLKYLKDYASHFSVLPHVKFDTKVLSADPVVQSESESGDAAAAFGNESRWCRWSVKYQQNGCQEQCEEFDAVVVCNGYKTFFFLRMQFVFIL